MFNGEMVKRKSPFEKKIGLTIFLVQDKVGLRKFLVQDKVGLRKLLVQDKVGPRKFSPIFFCKKP